MWQIMTLWNQVGVMPSAMLPASVPTCVLHVPMVHENGGWQNFHSIPLTFLPQQLLSWTTAVCIEMQPQSDVKVCNHFPGNNKEVARRLSILGNESAVLRLRLRAAPRQHQFSARCGEIAG